MVTNKEIRDAIQRSGLKYWEVAELLEITDGMFSKKLRHELSKEEKDKILNLINNRTRR